MDFVSKIYAFDIEIFKNFFSIVFSEVNSEFDDYEFIISQDIDDRQKLINFMNKSNLTLVGFNNIHFDNVILNGVISGLSCYKLWEIAQSIIKGDPDSYVKKLKWQRVSYKSIDLMKIKAFDKLGIGLKQVAISLKWPMIQELPLPYDKEIDLTEIELLLSYNRNDVGITKALYHKLLLEIEMRQELSHTYKLDLMSASDSRIGNLVFENLYHKETGLDPKYFKTLRTDRLELEVSDCISSNIKFHTPQLKKLLEKLKKIKLLKSRKFNLDISVSYADKIFDLGIGGLHSQDKAGIFKEDNDYLIIDADVSSFYPSIMLIDKIKPAHLTDAFLYIYRNLVIERIEAKKANEKIKAGGLKITINAIFGKMGFEHSWFYDPQACYSVTISGQLYLLMLIESLYEAGFEILSANTDGVLCKVSKSREDEYYQICKDWELKTKFELEWGYYNTYARMDVNNYIAQKKNLSYKYKGLFEPTTPINKGYRMPIVAKALKSVLFDGLPIDKTIKNGNIYDFLITEKSSKKFDIVYKQDGIIPCQHTNRWYVSLTGGQLLKTDGKREITLCSTGLVTILNDIKEVTNPIDYSYYKKEVQKILHVVRPEVKSLSLF